MGRLRLARPRDVVEHGAALPRHAGDEGLAVPLIALMVEPRQAAAHRRLQVRVVAQHEVHEFGDAGLRGAPRALVPGHDQVYQHPHGLPLVRRELLRLVGQAARQRLARAGGGFPHRVGGEGERRDERRHGEQAHGLAPVHSVRPSDPPTVRHSAPCLIWLVM